MHQRIAMAHYTTSPAPVSFGNTSRDKVTCPLSTVHCSLPYSARYEDFLILWKEADGDLSILRKARHEYSLLPATKSRPI
jgi:hypothetical protein